MKTKIVIKSYLGDILFEYGSEDNTVKKTVEQANLSGADLSRADLSRAYLSGADLSGANLLGADLSGANLSRANLSRAYLSRAYLLGANLSRVDLSRVDLSRADLSGANLLGAYLSGVNLSGAYLSGVKGLYKILQIGPIGSRNAFLVAMKENKDSEIVLRTGCFQGSVKEFLANVEKTHGDNKQGKAYRDAVKFIQRRMKCVG